MKISIAAAIGLVALTMTEAVKVNPLPAPVTIKWASSGPVKVDNNFRIVGPKNDILSKAYARTASLIKSERWTPQTWEQPIGTFPPYPILSKKSDVEDSSNHHGKATLKTINVVVSDLKADLQLGVDESYTLDITAAGQGTIKSKTVWGALNAFQTLNQIIINDGHNGLHIEQPVHIEDAPKYSHRGVLYDTGRNFYNLKSLYRQIDALSYAKMNVFHWHITDSQSWPVEIKKHPQMTKDAYSSREVYSQKDIAALIKYGRERGVRIIPEVDMPGHSSSGWKQVDPKAVTCADSWWDNDGWTYHSAVEPNPGQLDISYDGTYKLIKDVYSELSKVFTDNVFHVGFDELQTYCFNYSTSAMDWFKSRPGSTYPDFAQYYIDHALPIFQDKPSRRLMMWEDVILSPDIPAKKVPTSVIMQSWNNGVENIQKLAAAGYDIVVSSSDFVYLDCGYGGWVTNDPRYNVNAPPPLPQAIQDAFNDNPSAYTPVTTNYQGFGASWCAPYKTWQRMYDYDFTAGLTAAEAKHILGGEAAIWSEQSDSAVIDNKVWPRTAAWAESLWSGNRNAQGYKRTTELSARIFEFRERLLERGINAAPLVPKYCLQHPHHCDLYLNQTALGM
ncbi:hexosaminidase [Entomortierella parvispora]|uniref:Beta-hexosaminidase n=1 Tax=Entomortierella parvispora TaxID=205924 RepID=A0A9P3HII8_9FUNG|nr:hexosaminidase [Entomortierella parvispora]